MIDFSRIEHYEENLSLNLLDGDPILNEFNFLILMNTRK